MKYSIEFKPRAIKDIKALDTRIQDRILASVGKMSDKLKGDVKRLTNATPEYRLRVGEHRILFEIDGNTIIVYRIRHRREAYR